jgi:hypothetical protein
LRKKLGVERAMRSILIDAPHEAVDAIGVPGESVEKKLDGSFDYIHYFATSRDDLDAMFPKLKDHLGDDGKLWISWPKGGKLGTDLTLQTIIGIGYSHGLVESKTISVDATWSAIKFTFPKAGKQYNNKYGKLGERRS